MKKKGEIVSNMITIAVGLIIGIVMLGIIFSQISEQTVTTPITADQFTGANGTCVSITTNCIVSASGVLINSTGGNAATGNFTQCDSNSNNKLDGYSLNAVGGSPGWNGETINASYNERSCAFIEGSITTLIVNNVPVLFAVALLVFLAAFIVLK